MNYFWRGKDTRKNFPRKKLTTRKRPTSGTGQQYLHLGVKLVSCWFSSNFICKGPHSHKSIVGPSTIVWVFEILGGVGVRFSHKQGGVDKIGEELVWKKGVLLIFIPTNLFQCCFSECLVCVCIFFIYATSISIFCVSPEQLSLIESYQQICGFCKWVIFEKQNHCSTL